MDEDWDVVAAQAVKRRKSLEGGQACSSRASPGRAKPEASEASEPSPAFFHVGVWYTKSSSYPILQVPCQALRAPASQSSLKTEEARRS